jgi:hypothetical protein
LIILAGVPERSRAQTAGTQDSALALEGQVERTMQPAYRVVEGVSDGVYNFMRNYVVESLLPDRLTSGLWIAPEEDSARLFNQNLRMEEMRLLLQTRESYPITSDGVGSSDAALLQQWRSRAMLEQQSAVAAAFKETLLQRYQLEFFGPRSDNYLGDHGNWDPASLTMAGIIGGFLLYFDGMRARAQVADWELGIDLRSGLHLQETLRRRPASAPLARLELGYHDRKLALVTEWGLANGRPDYASVGLEYRLRY